MGLFRRDTDDSTATDPQQDFDYQKIQEELDHGSHGMAVNVDGILPPGSSPQTTVSSQASPVQDDNSSQTTDPQQMSQPYADPTANDAGDFIMADPPTPVATVPVEPPAQTAAPVSFPSDIKIPEPIVIPSIEASPEIEIVESKPEEPEVETADDSEDAYSDNNETSDTNDDETTTTSNEGDDLADIKVKALQQLSSIAGHLEQSPEEKFHTTMMMLQATDDQSLIKTAYGAAQSISDEKARAQALLDIVNEINYFSQKS